MPSALAHLTLQDRSFSLIQMIALLLSTAASVLKSRRALVLENLALRQAKDCPETKPVEPPHLGVIQAEPMVGGLHHRYFRQAA